MSESTEAHFLSYASQDAPAARRVCEALRGARMVVEIEAKAVIPDA